MTNNDTNHDQELHSLLTARPIPSHLPTFDAELKAKFDSIDSEHRSTFSKRRFGIYGGLTTAVAGAAAAIIVAGQMQTPARPNSQVALPTSTSSSIPQQVTPSTELPQFQLASQVSTAILTKYASYSGVSGTIIHTIGSGNNPAGTPAEPNQTFNIAFKQSADGRWYTKMGTAESSYDPSTDLQTDLDSSSTGPIADVFPGTLGGGPEGSGSFIFGGSSSAFGSLLDYLNGANDVPVKSATVKGHDVWQFDFSIPGQEQYKGSVSTVFNHDTISFDKSTLLPVQTTATFDGVLVYDDVYESIVVNPAFKDSDFKVKIPAGLSVTEQTPTGYSVYKGTSLKTTQPNGFALGYVPDGFTLSNISTGKALGPFTGNNVMENQTNKNAVAMTYRSGLREFTVTVRTTEVNPTDPLAAPYDSKVISTKSVLSGGKYVGMKVQAERSALATAHLWGAKGTTLITVSGEITQDDMLQIANGLTVPQG